MVTCFTTTIVLLPPAHRFHPGTHTQCSCCSPRVASVPSSCGVPISLAMGYTDPLRSLSLNHGHLFRRVLFLISHDGMVSGGRRSKTGWGAPAPFVIMTFHKRSWPFVDVACLCPCSRADGACGDLRAEREREILWKWHTAPPHVFPLGHLTGIAPRFRMLGSVGEALSPWGKVFFGRGGGLADANLLDPSVVKHSRGLLCCFSMILKEHAHLPAEPSASPMLSALSAPRR